MGSQKTNLRLIEDKDSDVKNRDEIEAKIDVAYSIRRLQPYEVVESRGSEQVLRGDKAFKLDWNESTISPSPKALAAIQSFVSGNGGLNWYPSLGSRSLADCLSEYTQLPAENILVTAGSDAALQLICDTYLDTNDEVVVPVPTYNHFLVFAQSRGVRLISIQPNDPFSVDFELLESTLSNRTRLVYLVSPNNPTGTIFTAEQIERLCTDFPRTLFVVDEAYFEFAQITSINLVTRFKNLLVTRTFSKAFGLAGLRIGYLAAHQSLIDGLSKIYNPKSVSTLSQIGAEAALSDLSYLNAYLDEVSQSKTILLDYFRSVGIDAFSTPANFLVVRLPQIEDTLSKLSAESIYIRNRSNYPGLADCARMSVGTVEQTQSLIQQLSRIF